MSEEIKFSKTRQYVTCTGLVAVLALLSAVLLYYGRQHPVILENRGVELPDGSSLRSLPAVLVAVNLERLTVGGPASPADPPALPALSFKFWPQADQSIARPVEMLPRERVLVRVLGPSFNLKAEVLNAPEGESTKSIDQDVHIGFNRDGMVSLVKLANGRDDYFGDFPNDAIKKVEQEDAATDGAPVAGDAPADF